MSDKLRQLFELDNTNVRRGIFVVGAMVLLGGFLMIQVLDGSDRQDELAGPIIERSVVPDTAQRTQKTKNTVRAADATVATQIVPSDITSTTSVGAPGQLSAIKVKVLNGARWPGVATELSGRLSALGYDVLKPADTPNIASQSAVLYQRGSESEARDLIRALGRSEIQASEISTANQPSDGLEGIDLVVVIGRDGAITGGQPN